MGSELQFSPSCICSPMKTLPLLNLSSTNFEIGLLEKKNCPKYQIMALGFPPLLDLGPPNSHFLGSSQVLEVFKIHFV